MRWLLLQGMLGIVLIGACRVNESSCNRTEVSGWEWIRLIEHLNKWEYDYTHTHTGREALSVTQPPSNTRIQSIYTSSTVLIMLLLPGSPAMAFQLGWEPKTERTWNINEQQMIKPSVYHLVFIKQLVFISLLRWSSRMLGQTDKYWSWVSHHTKARLPLKSVFLSLQLCTRTPAGFSNLKQKSHQFSYSSQLCSVSKCALGFTEKPTKDVLRQRVDWNVHNETVFGQSTCVRPAAAEGNSEHSYVLSAHIIYCCL